MTNFKRFLAWSAVVLGIIALVYCAFIVAANLGIDTAFSR
jgi:hypothetical protein